MQKDYSKHYNENSLWRKVQKAGSKAGQQVVYAALLLYYVMKDPSVETKHKLTIAAALGYFILPIDAIPDLAPVIGYTDDLGALVLALVKIYSAITPEIKEKARAKLKSWFEKVDESQLLALESRIGGATN